MLPTPIASSTPKSLLSILSCWCCIFLPCLVWLSDVRPDRFFKLRRLLFHFLILPLELVLLFFILRLQLDFQLLDLFFYLCHYPFCFIPPLLVCFCDIRHYAHQLIFYLVFKKRIFSLTLFLISSSSLRTFSIGKSASVKLPIVFTELDETPRAWNASLVSWIYMSNVVFRISVSGRPHFVKVAVGRSPK